MAIEEILEKVIGHPFLEINPLITLRIKCSCGKKYYTKREFVSWNNTYETKEECPKCKGKYSLKHTLYKDDNVEKYTVEIVK